MSAKNYGLIDSIDELGELFEDIKGRGNAFGFDIETGYEGPDRDKGAVRVETALIAGVSFTDSTDWARYVPLGHDEGNNLLNQPVARLLWDLLWTGQGVAHNAVFELRHLARWFRTHLWNDPVRGRAVQASRGYYPIRSDTMVEAYLMADFERFGLKPLTLWMFDKQGNPVDARQYRLRVNEVAAINKIKDPADKREALDAFDGHAMTELMELFPDLPKNRAKTLRFNTLPLTPQVVEYACEDSAWCLAIHQHYHRRVTGERSLLFTVEKTIVEQVVPAMEDAGIQYDWVTMQRKADELRAFRDKFNAEIMTDLSELAGLPVAVNLASPKQVREILFDTLGYRTTVYTTTTRDLPPGQRVMSTGDIALRKLAQDQPVVKKILQWREQTKLLGTYLDKYEKLFKAEDGRAHPNHLSAFVVTGRFAVSDPPYQGSPKTYHFDVREARLAHEAGEEPPAGTCFRFNFRDCIIAPPEHYILGFDLSQAELRAIAGEAQETALLEAFANGDDVHRLTASLMLGVPLDQVTKEMRDVGKTMNFALLYGMGVKSLADRLGIDIDEAQALMDKYFAGFPRIAEWSANQIAKGKRDGYVTSKFGRKLPIWEYLSDKRWIYQKGDRACVNYPIQGAATGDAMKIAMVRATAAIKKAGLLGKMQLVMNIHDALEFYVHKSITPEQAIAVLRAAVVFPIPGWPTMQADWHIAKKWGSPIEIQVAEDGSITVKGEKVFEEKPAIEVDEETGEVIEVLPEITPDAVRQALTAGGRQLIMTLAEMPTQDRWSAFVAILDKLPGYNHLRVQTPEGTITLPYLVGLTPEHLGQVSALFPGVQLAYETADVDPDAIMSGLAL